VQALLRCCDSSLSTSRVAFKRKLAGKQSLLFVVCLRFWKIGFVEMRTSLKPSLCFTGVSRDD
jgi:hypothetical protein